VLAGFSEPLLLQEQLQRETVAITPKRRIMGVRLRNAGKKRDWRRFATAAGDAAVQAATLASLGIGNPTSGIFRTFEALKGDDPIEVRALTLVAECLTYAVTDTISGAPLSRRPQASEAGDTIERFLTRASNLIEQREIVFQPEHMSNPESFPLFQDATRRIADHIRTFEPQESDEAIKARFRSAVARGINRIRARRPEYFQPLVYALSGSDAATDARERAWSDYRARLISRFEDAPLFGEDGPNATTIAEVYVPLRGSWTEPQGRQEELKRVDVEEEIDEPQAPVHVIALAGHVMSWLAKTESKNDSIRLISGGPGSGKSTFARQLAADLAADLRWRTLLIPLQRLRGVGPLDRLIDEYFTTHGDEPFRSDTAPLATLGRDEHRDWIIIFDGLDELAKEGVASEAAAQEFASSLLDWRVRIGNTADVRFLVLGRAPSMQEARRRLALQGDRTIHVADMRPINEQTDVRSTTLVGDEELIGWDQRPFFWQRWAAAKGKDPSVPEAITHTLLDDLTKEPLLAYLLILSGYVSDDRWKEAADNRNLIYKAIFDQIWDRERQKDTRSHLNSLGHETFKSLMRSLALAAWRGGGRTGDAATFRHVRSTFMPPGHLKLAEEHGAADLANVALLFYTRHDESTGAGYEFLHKSFGEYLTAQGILDAFLRWGTRAANEDDEFTVDLFCDKWLSLVGATNISLEVVKFLNDEVRLTAGLTDESRLRTGREWVTTATLLMDSIIKDGFPAHRHAATWRGAEAMQRNAEETLFAVLSSCAKVAYPMSLLGSDQLRGGWTPGPVKISTFRTLPGSFPDLVGRLSMRLPRHNTVETFPYQLVGTFLSRLDLSYVDIPTAVLYDSDFTACDLQGAVIEIGRLSRWNLSKCNLARCDFGYTWIEGCRIDHSDLTGATFLGAIVRNSTFRSSILSRVSAADVVFENCDFENASGARTLKKRSRRSERIKRT
jgi:hypothetical protein